MSGETDDCAGIRLDGELSGSMEIEPYLRQ
jgi:hypothetical protein